jgi:NAD(P)H-flavin reductase
MATYRPFLRKIESIGNLTPTEKIFRLAGTDGAAFGQGPGQFIKVSIFGIGAAPIFVSSPPTRGDYLDLPLRRVGRLTSAPPDSCLGESVGLRGPLGASLDVSAMARKDLLLTCGGCALAARRFIFRIPIPSST